MKLEKIWAIYFSGTGTTRRTVERIACRVGPSGFFQKAQKGIFVFRFAVVAVIVL